MVMGVGNSFPFECKRPEAGGWAMGMVRSRQSGARGGTTTSRERVMHMLISPLSMRFSMENVCSVLCPSRLFKR